MNHGLFSRRDALCRMGAGFGGLALATLFSECVKATPRTPQPHFAPKAKAVIQLFMHGGPSHVDLLDPSRLAQLARMGLRNAFTWIVGSTLILLFFLNIPVRDAATGSSR